MPKPPKKQPNQTQLSFNLALRTSASDTDGEVSLDLSEGALLVEEDELNESEFEDEELDEEEEDWGFGRQQRYFTVSELTQYLETVLNEDPILGNTLVVKGELSNVKRSARGHIYFTLKDPEASVGGIIWASLAKRLAFDIEDGLEVYLTGQVEIYAPSGTYSIVAQSLEPVGVGSLQLAFQQTKERLEAEGLFLPEFKKSLPAFPERIGIITSSTGAVIHDMLRVIRRKNQQVDVLLHPVKVQGEGAAEEIAAAIRELNYPDYALDVLIVARGGGSFEDLFCFSDEQVVRAIFASDIPIITGIGHEPDYSLADAVADYSASTPTAAAEAAVPDTVQLAQILEGMRQDLANGIVGSLYFAEQQFDRAATALVDSFRARLDDTGHRLVNAQQNFEHESTRFFQALEQRLSVYAAELDAFSPLATLARGYAIARTPQGHVITSPQDVTKGDALTLILRDGQITCEVTHDKPC